MVEIEPLTKALREKKLLGAAIDVFPTDPKSNKVFGVNHINIASQYLQTSGDIGYVVIDIDAAHSDVALEKLADVPGTIRSRVLF